MRTKIVHNPGICLPNLIKSSWLVGFTLMNKKYTPLSDTLIYEGRMYILDTPCCNVICHFCEKPNSSHCSAIETTEHVSREFYLPGMDVTVGRYFAQCEVCHWVKINCYLRDGINMSLSSPFFSWKCIAIKTVTNLHNTMALANISILAVVGWLTKKVINMHRQKDIQLLEQGQNELKHIICADSILDDIITDCGTKFTSQFKTNICSCMSTNHRHSTAIHCHMDKKTLPPIRSLA